MKRFPALFLCLCPATRITCPGRHKAAKSIGLAAKAKAVDNCRRICKIVENYRKIEKKCEGAPRKFSDYIVTIDDKNLPVGVSIEEQI